MLFLTNVDVEAVRLELADVIDIVAAALSQKAAGSVELPPKLGLSPRPGAVLHAMPARIGEALGMKWIASFPANRTRGLPPTAGLALPVARLVLPGRGVLGREHAASRPWRLATSRAPVRRSSPSSDRGESGRRHCGRCVSLCRCDRRAPGRRAPPRKSDSPPPWEPKRQQASRTRCAGRTSSSPPHPGREVRRRSSPAGSRRAPSPARSTTMRASRRRRSHGSTCASRTTCRRWMSRGRRDRSRDGRAFRNCAWREENRKSSASSARRLASRCLTWPLPLASCSWLASAE